MIADLKLLLTQSYGVAQNPNNAIGRIERALFDAPETSIVFERIRSMITRVLVNSLNEHGHTPARPDIDAFHSHILTNTADLRPFMHCVYLVLLLSKHIGTNLHLGQCIYGGCFVDKYTAPCDVCDAKSDNITSDIIKSSDPSLHQQLMKFRQTARLHNIGFAICKRAHTSPDLIAPNDGVLHSYSSVYDYWVTHVKKVELMFNFFRYTPARALPGRFVGSK